MPRNAPTEEDLLRLVAAAKGKEHPDLDFKRDLVLQSKADKCELAKDVAAQANLPTGGGLVFGVTNIGEIIGLQEEPDRDRVADVLSSRLQFPPAGIRLDVVDVTTSGPDRVPKVLWIRVPPSPSAIPTCAQAVDGTFRAPIRVDTKTRYLNPAEALARYLGTQRSGESTVRSAPPELRYDAEPDSVAEQLDSNLLPILEIPQTLWAAKTTYSPKEIAETLGTRLVPHRLIKGRICTFRPTAEATSAFSEVTESEPVLLETARIMTDRDWRRVVIGLLNQELARLLVRKGLLWDADGGRAYFSPEDGRPRQMSWKAFSRTGTRTVVGIKYRAKDIVDHWYHFAVALRVQDLESRLAVVVIPDWFFTYDGVEPLHSFDVAAAATPRMNLEDNARVLYNTHFWVHYLSGGARHIEIPLGGGALVVASEPLKLNVPFGIAGDKIRLPDAPSGLDAPPEITWHKVQAIEEREQEDLGDWS